MKDFNNIIFIGGIHGVGKSTICQDICRKIEIEYLSASKLLKWTEKNMDSSSKKVNDIPNTQNQLITALKQIVRHDKLYLLDGHYCLFNSNNDVECIPVDTFKEIGPIAFYLILGDTTEIIKNLEERDSTLYKIHLLDQLQDCEKAHANHLSKTLDVPIEVYKNSDYDQLMVSVAKLLKIK